MTTRERLFLTPVEKFLKYGIIPWKLLLNIALVILVTSQVRATPRLTVCDQRAAGRTHHTLTCWVLVV
ncbi:hypothetical protein EON66_01515 [archaeon]|nr:MAG: hypothetical protein EON66_01515 [archaeon]